LSPKSDLHLQFAYYESSLVVEYLVQQFGFESLKQVLHDLGEGAEINAAIAAHTKPIGEFEKDFAAFARERAERLAPGLDWKKYKPIDPDISAAALADLVDKNPTNFWALTDYARKLVADKKWDQAKVPLKKLLETFPGYTGANNAYLLLAATHRGLNETNEEREVLSKLAAIDADATGTFQRLMELNETAKDWPGVAQNAERFLAVNPLLPQPYRCLARANEELSHTDAAIQTYDKLLLLDPPDPAQVHFRLARLLRQRGDPAAKRHVLQALEEAPRYRDAHGLLLELTGERPGSNAAAPAAESKP
jgi:tetratricopeptide (TPR) repeat protein